MPQHVHLYRIRRAKPRRNARLIKACDCGTTLPDWKPSAYIQARHLYLMQTATDRHKFFIYLRDKFRNRYARKVLAEVEYFDQKQIKIPVPYPEKKATVKGPHHFKKKNAYGWNE